MQRDWRMSLTQINDVIVHYVSEIPLLHEISGTVKNQMIFLCLVGCLTSSHDGNFKRSASQLKVVKFRHRIIFF